MRVIQSVDPSQTGVSSREAFAEIDRRNQVDIAGDNDNTQRVLWHGAWRTFHNSKTSRLRGFIYDNKSRVYGTLSRSQSGALVPEGTYVFTSNAQADWNARRAEDALQTAGV